MTDELVTIAEAVQRFEVSPSTLRRMWRAGDLAGAHSRPGMYGDEVAIPVTSLASLFSPRDPATAVDEVRRLLALLEAMHASHEREVVDLRARLAKAERERDEAIARVETP